MRTIENMSKWIHRAAKIRQKVKENLKDYCKNCCPTSLLFDEQLHHSPSMLLSWSFLLTIIPEYTLTMHLLYALTIWIYRHWIYEYIYIHHMNIKYILTMWICSTYENSFSPLWQPLHYLTLFLCLHFSWNFQLFCCTNTEMKKVKKTC